VSHENVENLGERPTGSVTSIRFEAEREAIVERERAGEKELTSRCN